MFRRTTDEQVDVVGLNGQVDNLQALVVGYFVEDGSHTVGDLVDEYRLAVLRQPHYVVVEVVGRVPCGLHPCCILWFAGVLILSVKRGKSSNGGIRGLTHYAYRSTSA